jgi:hypothetical protein
MNASAGSETKNAVGASLVAALVHGLLWLILLGWLAIHVPLADRTMEKVNLRLPWLAEEVKGYSRPAVNHPGLFGLGLIAFVAVDCWILQRLGRPPSSRVARELWSGLMAVLPTVLLCLVALATLLPFVKLAESVVRTADARDPAVQEERKLLPGK